MRVVCSIKTIVTALLTLVLAGCSGLPHVSEPQPEVGIVRSHKVTIISHGWHTGLILPASELNQAIPELAARFPHAAFYEIGWGDKGFYQSQEITVGLTIQAMFWSEGAVLHVVAVPTEPERYFSGSSMTSTCLSENELSSLTAFLLGSFARDSSNRVVPLRRGIYGDSEFCDGVGSYYLLNTCNKWTAKALRSAGLDIDPTLKLTANSVMGYLGEHARACAAPVTALSGGTVGERGEPQANTALPH